MRIFDRYLRRAVLSGTLVVLLVLLPLVAFLLLADELDSVGTGDYTLASAFAYIGLTMPRYAYQLLPIAALVGGLLGLGGLASHSELTAMRAAGISVGRILWGVLKAGAIAAVLALIMGEVVAPISDERANQMRVDAMSENIALKSRYGFWARDGAAFINIREILPGGRLRGIYIYEMDESKRLRLSTLAHAAVYTGDAWRLEGIVQSRFEGDAIETRTLNQAQWSSLLDPAMLSLLVVDPHILPVWGLYRYIRFMEDNGLNAVTYYVAFWDKIATPLVILTMIFLSVPLLFSGLRSAGVGHRVFIGVLIGGTFFIVNQAFSQLAVVYSISPMLTAFTPGLLCLGAGLLVLQRIR
jgi:lipopolysaccharide export system permease protein